MAAQSPVVTQRIWGAFTPSTNRIVGVQISGETPYQNIPNELLATNQAGVRTATNAATNVVVTLGKVTQADGGGNTFVYNPADTTTGAVAVGSSAGTVLNISSLTGTGLIAVGMTVSSSLTGAPMGVTILSFGTGTGGAGTYNLSGTLNQVGPFTFLIDGNSTILVGVDGSRWYVNSTALPPGTGLTAPSGNPAVTLTTPLYTLGNTTDNPSITMVGTGTFTVPKLTVNTGPSAFTGNVSISGGTFTSRGILDQATAVQETLASTGLVTFAGATAPGQSLQWNLNSDGVHPDAFFLASQNAQTFFVVENNNAGAAVQVNIVPDNGTQSSNLGITGTGFTGTVATNIPAATKCHFWIGFGALPLFIGSNGNALMQFNSAGTAISGFGPTAAAYVDMTPDTGSFTGTLTGFTTTVTGTCTWARISNVVILNIPAMNGTSNTTSMTLTGIPSAINPAKAVQNVALAISNSLTNSGASVTNPGCEVQNSNTVTFYIGGSSTGFTASGTKGIVAPITLYYQLN